MIQARKAIFSAKAASRECSAAPPRWNKRSRPNPNRNSLRRIFSRPGLDEHFGEEEFPPPASKPAIQVGPLRRKSSITTRRHRQTNAHTEGLTLPVPDLTLSTAQATPRSRRRWTRPAGLAAGAGHSSSDIARFSICLRQRFLVVYAHRPLPGSVPSIPHVRDFAEILTDLPLYALYLASFRISAAYALSLIFALRLWLYRRQLQGAPKSSWFPLLDILQSIPVLSFLPGVMLAMVADLSAQPNSASSSGSISAHLYRPSLEHRL